MAGLRLSNGGCSLTDGGCSLTDGGCSLTDGICPVNAVQQMLPSCRMIEVHVYRRPGLFSSSCGLPAVMPALFQSPLHSTLAGTQGLADVSQLRQKPSSAHIEEGRFVMNVCPTPFLLERQLLRKFVTVALGMARDREGRMLAAFLGLTAPMRVHCPAHERPTEHTPEGQWGTVRQLCSCPRLRYFPPEGSLETLLPSFRPPAPLTRQLHKPHER